MKGEVRTKAEDSIRLYCYCNDCRNSAQFIAKLGNKTAAAMIYPCGETHQVLVCKNAVTIHQGLEHMRFARKQPGGMFRYYASCCYTPLMNVYRYGGLVGIMEDTFDDNDAVALYKGPYCHCTKDVTKPISLENVVPNLPILLFLWIFLRCLPWMNAGPFHYNSSKPIIYWGGSKKVDRLQCRESKNGNEYMRSI